MELSKKTTILLTPELHERLVRLARQRGESLGSLVREACVAQYGLMVTEDRLTAVDELARLRLPVGDPESLKRESAPEPRDLLP